MAGQPARSVQGQADPAGKIARKTSRQDSFRKPPTAQQAVLEELRRGILEGDLKPGAKIFQESIAEQLGLSRVPVREALKILEGEGQVTYTAHRGYVVAELDYQEFSEIYRMRELLETEAVRASVPCLGDADFDTMRAALAEMEEAETSSSYFTLTAANRTFHFALFEPSGMTRLVRVIRQLWDSSDPYRSLYISDARNRTAIDHEHREILAAAVARDTDELMARLDAHRDRAQRSLQSILRTAEEHKHD